jgi:hypothetical protein
MGSTTASPAMLAPDRAAPSAEDSAVAPSGERRSSIHWLGVLLVGALGLRLWLWSRAYAFEQGDPVEYVNIAYRIAFGIGIPWWDLRPLLLSLIYVPVLFVAQLWPDPTGEAMIRALRLVSVAFSLGCVALTYLIGRRLGGELVGVAGGALVAVNPVFNHLSVSTYAEVPSTFFILLAIWMLARPDRAGTAPILAGLALGTACMIRYQAIAFVPPIGLWVLATAISSRASTPPFSPRSLLGKFSLGLAVAVLIQAAIETVAYGRPFHSLLVSFDYNVTSGLAPVEFGSEPFTWFIQEIREWLGYLPLALVVLSLPILSGGPRVGEWRLLALTALAMFFFLSALPHKELRFTSQVLPLLAIFAGQGLTHIQQVAQTLLSPHSAQRTCSGPLPGGERAGTRALRGVRATHRTRTIRNLSATISTIATLVILVLTTTPPLVASLALDLAGDIAYVDGAKRAAALKPDGVLGTIPWFVPRPYTGTRMTLERMDRNVWKDREHVARVVEESDFLLFPEYWLLEDDVVRRQVDSRYKTVESYRNGVVLLQNKRLDPAPPPRRRN